jgi:hypothetical protein
VRLVEDSDHDLEEDVEATVRAALAASVDKFYDNNGTMRDVMKALRTRYPNEYNQCSKAWLREVVDEIVATRNVYPDDSPPSRARTEWRSPLRCAEQLQLLGRYASCSSSSSSTVPSPGSRCMDVCTCSVP